MMRLLKPLSGLKKSAAAVALFAFFPLAEAAIAEPHHQPEATINQQRLTAEEELLQRMGGQVRPQTRQSLTQKQAPPEGTQLVGSESWVAEAQRPQKPQEEESPQAGEDTGTRTTTAPGQFEVDEDAAERALERTLVLTGALLLPFGKAEIQPSFTYVRSEMGFPTFFFEEDLQFVATQTNRRDFFLGDLTLRFGLPFDSQLEVAVPYQYIREQDVITVGPSPANEAKRSASGLGDVQLGLAKGLLHERDWLPNLIGRVTWTTGSGQTNSDILFSGFESIEGSLTAIKSQDPLVFIGSASYERMFRDNDFTLGDNMSFAVGALLAASPETSLRVILNQTFLDEFKVNGTTIPGSNRVIGTLNFGASSVLGRGLFLDFNAGIGVTDNAPDYTIGLSLVARFDVPFIF